MQPPFVSPPPPSPQQPCCGSTPGRFFHRPSLSELFPTSTTPRNTPHDLFPDGSSALSPDLDPKFRRSESACRLRGTMGALVGMLEPNITRRQTQPSTTYGDSTAPAAASRAGLPTCMHDNGGESKQASRQASKCRACISLVVSGEASCPRSFWCFCVASLSRSHFPGDLLWGP